MPATNEARWDVPVDVMHEIDSAVEDHVAVLRTLRALFSARMDHEKGLAYEELFDVDRTLAQAAEGLRRHVGDWSRARRRALGIPEAPAIGRAAREDGDPLVELGS